MFTRCLRQGLAERLGLASNLLSSCPGLLRSWDCGRVPLCWALSGLFSVLSPCCSFYSSAEALDWQPLEWTLLAGTFEQVAGRLPHPFLAGCPSSFRSQMAEVSPRRCACGELGDGSTANQQAHSLPWPGYLEDSEAVCAMVSAHKAGAEPGEGHLIGRQAVRSEKWSGFQEPQGYFWRQKHLAQLRGAARWLSAETCSKDGFVLAPASRAPLELDLAIPTPATVAVPCAHLTEETGPAWGTLEDTVMT